MVRWWKEGGVQIVQRDGFCLDPDPMPQAVVYLFLSTYCDSPSNTPRAVVSGNGDDLVLDLLVAPRGFAIPPFEALLACRRPVLDGGVGPSVNCKHKVLFSLPPPKYRLA